MPRPLKALIVEDNPHDAELMISELRREGFDLVWERVETEAQYSEKLRSELDVILSDHTLPRFSAPRALEILQDRGLDIPFIIVSGTINEEDAIAAMRLGAADYLLKDRLARLGAAVAHALEEIRLRRERHEAVERLRLFRRLVDQSNDTFAVIDPETAHFLDVNEKGCAELGYGQTEYLRLRVFDIDATVSQDHWPALAKAIRTAGSLNREGSYTRKDGTTFPVEINFRWVELDRDYIVAVIRDVTVSKHVIHVLQESERRFREMLENVEMIAMTLDKNGTITFCNDYFLKLTGWQREEVLGGSWFTMFIPGNPEVKDMFLDNVESGRIPSHHENPVKTKAGALIDVSWNNTMLRSSTGSFIGTASIGEDVTERKRAERALRESEERFRSFMEHSPIAGWIVDGAGKYRYVSPGYYRMFNVGRTDLTGLHIFNIFPPDVAEHYLENNSIALRERRVVETQEKGSRRDGSPGEFMVVKFPMTSPNGELLLGGIAKDITERKKLEEQFLRAQRMESVGTLAGGIAHDLNNSLGPIIMSLDLLKLKFPDPDSMELLEIIGSSAQRGADMVKQVLSFGRGVEGRRMVVQVQRLVREIEKIVNDTFLKNIEVHVSLPDELWAVEGDPTQLHQVMLNLCLNSRDAMPSGGHLGISAQNLTIDEQFAAMHLEARPGPYVLIEVKDTGTGIPPEEIGKIFDPFFTTKEVGKGTGLGLSSTLGIVKNHKGFIRVESEPGQGTSFQIHLPAQIEGEADTAAFSEAALARGDGEIVLVVDDEAAVREITKQTLEAFGYRVILASDGAEALSVFARQGAEIAVVLMDLTMPVMDGPTTIQVLKRMNSSLPIIATSGRDTKGQLALIAGIGVAYVLEKPFTAEQLLRKLKEILSTVSNK